MLTRIVPWTLGCLLVAGAAVADDKPAASVKEIALKGLKVPGARGGNVSKPVPITSADELAKAVPDKDAQAAISKEVDFAKQQLALFAWSGSGGDRLTFTADESKSPVEVTFTRTLGRTRDLRMHTHLFVMPKGAVIKMADGR